MFNDSFGKRAPTYKAIIEKLNTGFFGLVDIANHIGWKKGGQIDLMIETKYTLYVFEIKFRRKTEKTIINEVAEKIIRQVVTECKSIQVQGKKWI